jgi:hypothetical protein
MLAFYTRNNEQIRRLFRMSMLGKRDKATDKYIDRMISRIRGNEPPPVEVSLSPPAFVLGKSAQSSQGSPFRVAAAPVTVDGETLLAQTFKPVQWAIYGIVPEGRTLLTGDPKIGKSWLGYQLCIAVATGSPLYPGAKPEVVGVALYLALEDNQRRVQSRLKKLIPHFSKRTETGFGAPSLEKLHVVCDWPRGVEGVRRLAEWLREHPDCRLVVIDTLAAFRSIEGGNKTAYRDDYELGEILKPLTTEFSVAIVLIGHNRKMQAGDVLQMVSGTQGLTGGVDNVIVMRRERGSMDAGLYVDGRDIEDPKEYALRFNNCLWRITGSVAEAQRSKERQAILEAVEELGEAAQPKEIATLLGKNGGAVRKLLHSMVADGELRNEGGVYAHPKS